LGTSLTSAAVLGFGTMGQGIARLLLDHGVGVTVLELEVEKAREAAVRLTAGAGPGASLTVHLSVAEAVADAEVVFEALPERLDLKTAVLREVLASNPSALLFTNTSSLPVDTMAATVGDPSTLVGVHFFNPAEVMPGVEVIPSEATGAEVVTRALSILEDLGKIPTVVRSSAGFIGNRLQLALFAEAARCVEEGLAGPEDVDRVVRTTFGPRLAAYGPFAIADMAGLDIFESILQQLQEAFGDRFATPPGLAERVAENRLGTKTLGGYFSYDEADVAARQTERDAAYQRIIDAARHTDQPAS
jgi:3-hydroxybutyryl-CoA dehydrogenase